jgi:hypothetical protein
MPYKTQNPHLGPTGKPESFSETEWPNGRVQLGYVHEQATKRWQMFKCVDAAVVADGDVLYVKNYAAYEATMTIANSAQNEVAGVAELAAPVNSFLWLRQGGLKSVKAAGVIAKGNQVTSDASDNRVIAAAGVVKPIGVAQGAVAAGKVNVFLTIAPI